MTETEQLLERNGQQPSVVDIFAAPGGLSLGFKQAGYRVLAAIDSDSLGCKTLSRNLSPDGTVVINCDITNLTTKGKVDVMVGGPPCQSLSIAGQSKIRHLARRGKRDRFIDDERNRLYKHFVKTLAVFEPQFFVMENVPAITTRENGRLCDQIVDDFRKVGYETDWRILNAADFGVPQLRKRAIFVGNRLGLSNPFPTASHTDLRSHQTTLGSTSFGYETVFDAISDLPMLRAGSGFDEMPYPQGLSLTAYQTWAREGSIKLYNHVARHHSERDQQAFAMLEPGQKMVDLPPGIVPYRRTIFPDKIKKQRWDAPSSAIVAHMQKDGLMYVHPDKDQARTFSPREAARLQSFPDRYRFMGPLTQQFKQVGNAVPPLMARAIASTIAPLLNPIKDPRMAYDVSKT